MHMNTQETWQHETISSKSHQGKEQETLPIPHTLCWNAREHTGKMAIWNRFKQEPPGKGTGRREGNEKDVIWQNELKGEFKMAKGEVINIGVGYEVRVHSNRNYKRFDDIVTGRGKSSGLLYKLCQFVLVLKKWALDLEWFIKLIAFIMRINIDLFYT